MIKKDSMHIKQYEKFEFKSQFNIYSNFGNSHFQNPISHVQFFLNDCYGYVRRAGGPIKFFANLQAPNGEWGMGFNELDLSVDIKKNLVYISELFFASNYQDIMTEEEFNIKSDEMSSLELYQSNILDSAVMSKDNFIHLLFAWDKILNQTPCFVLLYLDDKDWYDVLPFETQESMEKFIADHTENKTEGE